MSSKSNGKSIKAGESLTLAERLVDPFQRFGRIEAAGGILLLIMAAVAMLWANSPWGHSYHVLWHEIEVSVGIVEPEDAHAAPEDATEGSGAEHGGQDASGAALTPDEPLEAVVAGGDDAPGTGGEEGQAQDYTKLLGMSMPIGHWINDLVMAVFFLFVGLEIKREVIEGELSSPKKAALPVAAALGGMIVPALIYTAFHFGNPLTIRGWGVPMATDIAFALGVLALLGKRVPPGIKLFLTSLAIADDLGALLVIAIFYTTNLDMVSLAIAGGIWVVLLGMGAIGFRSLILYCVLGLALWWFVFHSGIHATIAGVLLAMTIPARPRVDARKFLAFTRSALDEFERDLSPDTSGKFRQTTSDQQEMVQAVENASVVAGSPLHRLEYVLGPWVGFLIVPVFALANSGVAIGGEGAGAVHDSVSTEARVGLGVALGLLLGKPIGVFLFSWLTVKLGLGALPKGVRWAHLHGMAWLAGIGFTMALFIANLAFKGHEMLLDGAKLGILCGSAVAAVVGLIILLLVAKRDVGGRDSGVDSEVGFTG